MDDPNLTSGRGAMAITAAVSTYCLSWAAGVYIEAPQKPTSILPILLNFTHPLIAGYLVPAISVGLAAVVGIWLYREMYIRNERHIRGARLHEDARAIHHAKGNGIRIHPDVQITQAQECRHILLMGGSGSGKTTIIWPIINQAIARGDKILIFSFKGDFQEKLNAEFTLLAPTDARSARWMLGQDIRTRLDAESLAETLVPTPEKDPMWAQGAQGLLTAVIADLQTEYGEMWGYKELAEACAVALSDYDSLLATVMRESPLAKAFLTGKDSKTTASYLSNMATNLSAVVNIGVADSSSSNTETWSVRRWLSGEDEKNAVIIGFKPSAATLSKAYVASVIEQVMRQILDMNDCSPEDRRIWLILDEIPQAGKVPSITQGLEAARSKGCRIVLGIQSIAQLEKVYDRETSTIWAGQTALKIMAQITAPSDQEWASKLLGEKEIERYTKQVSSSGTSASISGGFTRLKEHVMMPGEFGTRLNVSIPEKRVRALLITAEAAVIMDWPFQDMTSLRPMAVPAAWIKPGFKRPIWGAVPPVTAEPSLSNGLSEKKSQGAQVVKKNTLLEMPTAPVSDRQPEDKGEGGMVDEAGSMGLDHLLDAVAPGSSMLIEMLKMAMESEQGLSRLPQVIVCRQQCTKVTNAYKDMDEQDEE